MSARRSLLAVLLFGAAMTATPAAGVPAEGTGYTAQRVTTVQFRFIPEQVLVPTGDYVEYTNLDFVEHNIVSVRVDEEDKPLFQTDLVPLGGSATVPNIQSLPLGVYPFYCAPHPWMTGRIEIFDPPPGP